MQFGWEGQHVSLVPLEKRYHFNNCVRWLNDPTVTQWTLIGDFPLTRLAEEEFFDRVSHAGDQSTDIVFAIETNDENAEHVGVSGFHNINYRHGTAITGTIIGRPKLHGRGLGSDAIAVRTRYAFDVLGLRLLLSEVIAENVASLRALQKSGYREVGRIPARWWKRGAYRDAIILALPRDEWKS